MTFDYKTIPVRRELIDNEYKITGYSERRKTVTRRLRRDRRKQNFDRRSGIREGIIVSLSSKKDRRKGTDRRRKQGSRSRIIA